MRKSGLITLLMIAGLVVGALCGELLLHDPADPLPQDHWTGFVGKLILLRPLILMIVPLIFLSVTLGVASIGDPAKLGLVGGATLVFYVCSMVLASLVGAAMVTFFEPGNLPPEARQALTQAADPSYKSSDVAAEIAKAKSTDRISMGGAWLDVVNQIIPNNIVKEMADGRPLGIITFAILLGLALAVGGERSAPVVNVMQSLLEAVMRLVNWIIWIAPIGVALLVAWTVGRIGLEPLTGSLGKFMLVVMGGLAFHAFITLPIILAVFGHVNPFRFMWRVRRPLLMAFGTASSNATLPVTLETCINEGGCSRRATNFTVPLGATVNMDGTALFEAVGVIFLCQLYGIELQFIEVLVVVISATLAAIGAAGIPSAGLVTMVIVITAVNITLAGNNKPTLPESAIGVIVGIDRILDMCRTTVNVWDDMVAAKLISRLAPDESPAVARVP
jgi:solute carrier family 1 (neuronal/epithelial high affinity glutamate transporter), member 1